MSQTTSSGWAGAVAAAYRSIGTGVLASWTRASGTNNFFTIGASSIGGSDFIKSGGDFVAFFDKYFYSDYTQYAKNWSVTRKLGQFPFGIFMAQADVQFDNTSKIFTPGYDPTIGSGILPNRPMKISVSINNESLNQFVGFTDQPELSVTERQMTVHAFDAFNYLNNYTFTTSGTTVSGTLQNVYTHEILDYYLRKLGFSGTQFVLDTSLQSRIGFVGVTDRKIGDVFKDLVEAEQGLMFVDENGIFRFWNRQHFYTASGITSFSLNYGNMTSLTYQSTPIINDVTVTAKPRAAQSIQKVWEQTSTALIPANSTLEVFASFADDNGELPVMSIQTPIYFNGDTNVSSYSTNSASDGSGSPMNSYISVQSTYLFGTTYKIVFANSFSSNIYLTDLVLYGTPARVNSVIEQRYIDQVSVDNYNRNPANNGESLIISNDFIQDSSTAYSLAYTIVNEFKDPRRHYVAKVFANPAVQIGDSGIMTIPDTGEVKRVYIVGKKDVLGGEADLQQELTLEERNILIYFQIGASSIGGQDVIAP